MLNTNFSSPEQSSSRRTSVLRPSTFPLNDFFWRNTRPITTNKAGNILGEWGFR